jgi:hypothetical protein
MAVSMPDQRLFRLPTMKWKWCWHLGRSRWAPGATNPHGCDCELLDSILKDLAPSSGSKVLLRGCGRGEVSGPPRRLIFDFMEACGRRRIYWQSINIEH